MKSLRTETETTDWRQNLWVFFPASILEGYGSTQQYQWLPEAKDLKG